MFKLIDLVKIDLLVVFQAFVSTNILYACHYNPFTITIALEY